jgi:amino acid adenylation domain-containing protein
MNELNVEARIENLDKVLDFLNAELEAINCPQKVRKQLFIAAEEIFVNIAYYAYRPETGSALIRINSDENEIWIEFEDSGKPYNPLEKPDPDITVPVEDRPIGGLGIFMVKQIMDLVEYKYENNRNLFKIKKIVKQAGDRSMNYANLSVLKGRRVTVESGLTMADTLERQAQLFPENTAVVYKDFSITYSRFNLITNLLALELVRLGVSKGERVGIMADRNELVPISVFGIIKAGAVYVPLNPGFPSHRLLHMIHDAGIKHVIADGDIKKNIDEFKEMSVDIRGFLNSLDESFLAGASVTGTLPALAPGDIAALIYTSGSTGTPKGVMITHENILARAEQYKRKISLSPDDAVASYVSLSFVVHISVLFTTFAAGAALHFIGDDIRLDTRAVNKYFETHHIAAVFFPFSFGQKFILRENNHSLRSMTLGGENFIPLPELSLGYTLYNGYGCTECCSSVAIGEIRPGDTRITVGKPVDNTDVYILDDHGGLVDRGVKGELCVTGLMVSAGYLNHNEKTDEAFIKNPFSDEPGYERLYKTGDIGRITEDGNIEITGRVDFQIKISGYRIEPGEIDACIQRYPGIIESVAVAVENTSSMKQLISYVVADKKINSAELRNFISGFLPPYMVPRFIEQIEKLPRNMNGKIDRAKLPEPLLFTDNERALPETETEEKLARLWALVLGLEAEKIGRKDNFFELGGDSLRAIILTIEISKTFFKTDLSPAEVFQFPLLKEQARILDKSGDFRTIHIYSDTGKKTPVFFVHGGNIGSEAYAPLARKLPGDQPFYCFENYNMYNSGTRVRGIASLAETYIKLLRELVPQGPYILGGWSFGGLVAFEMACQFEAAGETVEHLYLLDPRLINNSEEWHLREKLPESNYREYLSKDPLFERFRRLGFLEKLIENNQEISRDVQHYIPKAVYRGSATLFKATRTEAIDPLGGASETSEILRRIQVITQKDRNNGFGNYIPNLRIIEIPEIHDGFMQGEALDIISSVMVQTSRKG